MARIMHAGVGWPVVVLALLLLAAAACTGGGSPAPRIGDGKPSPTAAATAAPEPTQRPADAGPTRRPLSGRDTDLEGPPSLTASASTGDAVEMGIGSYCWTAGRVTSRCADAVGIITQRDPLRVGVGETVRLSGDLLWGELSEIVVTAHEAAGEPMEMASGRLAWQPVAEGTNIEVSSDADGASFLVQLPPGAYVLTASVRVPQGDVSYGLLLEVA